ncbi:MAG TPA: tripartite tricarboxylate transporter TctB family protein [Burkholderiales bacterium]|nr:tripartite tricarboxylate transporter TctB family protein [Burkholderiales bacterium]
MAPPPGGASTSSGPDRGGLRDDQVSGAALAIAGVLIALQSWQYPIGSLAEPGPGYLPFALGVALAGFGALVAIAGGQSPAFRWAQFGDGPKALAILAGLAFAALALERLGYRITIAVLLLYYLGVLERRPWARTLVLTAIVSLGSYYVFARLLRVPLPIGMSGF